MRVLFLTDSYRPSRSACANRAVVLVDALRDAGMDVQVLASSDSLLNEPTGYTRPFGVTYFETFPLQQKTLINRLKNNFGGQRASIKAAMKMGNFDVVVCTTPPLLLTNSAVKIAKHKNAKLVLDVRDIWPDVAYEMGSFTPGSIYGRFFEHIAKRGLKSAALVSTVSPGKLEKLRGRVDDGRREDVILVPNGIDEAFLANREDGDIVKQFRLNEGRICCYVGNIGLAQGLDTLLNIAGQRPDVRFLLFGDGADRAKLQQRTIDEALSNVEFCGTVDGRGVFTVLRHSAVSFVPLVSSKLRDSIPTKFYECMACGCPVLLAAQGDAVDLLDEFGLGAHAAPEDSEGLLHAFDEVLSREYDEVEKATASRHVMEYHSRQLFAKRFAHVLLGRFGGQA